MKVIASGERAADLGVRLLYAGAEHTTVPDPMTADRPVPTGPHRNPANYTAFPRLGHGLERA